MGTGKRELGTGGRVSPRAARPMKPSGIPWLGDVPEGWEIDKIKYWFKATNTRGNTILQLLSATQKYGMYPQSKLEGIVQVAEKTDLNTFKTVHIDDFVISLRSFQGGIERSDYEGVCSPAYQTFHAMREINTGYFKYLFKSHGFIEAINRLTVGIREGKTINYSDVREMGVPFPPLPEQQAIAERIDCEVARVDALRDKIKCEIERLGDYKKSLIAETVTRGLRKRKMKPSGIPWLGDVPSEWEVTRLKYIITANDGGVWGDEPTGEGDTIVLRSTEQDISGNIRVIEPAWRHLSQGEIEKAVLKVGDLIITKSSGSEDHIGKTSLIDETIAKLNCCYSNFLQRIRVTDNPKFIWYVLNSEPTKEHFRRVFVTSTGLKNLNAAKIESVVFARPPLPEQREIAEYLDRAVSRIDAVVARRKAQLEKLESFKRSLIQEYVTGKREECL